MGCYKASNMVVVINQHIKKISQCGREKSPKHTTGDWQIQFEAVRVRGKNNYQLNILSDELINQLIQKIRLELLCYLLFLSSELKKNGIELLHNVVSISYVQQTESVICMHISTLFLDFLPIQVTTEHCVEFPVLDSWFSLVIYFICSINSVYILIFTLSFPSGVFPEDII